MCSTPKSVESAHLKEVWQGPPFVGICEILSQCKLLQAAQDIYNQDTNCYNQIIKKVLLIRNQNQQNKRASESQITGRQKVCIKTTTNTLSKFKHISIQTFWNWILFSNVTHLTDTTLVKCP